MADTNEDMKQDSVTSIHGRKIGLDFDNFIVGPKGIRPGITAATSATTGTALPNYGVVTIDSTTGDSYTLTAPKAGAEVKIIVTSTGGAQTILPVSGTFQSSASSTSGSITLTGGPAGIHLIGLSTSVWAPVARYGSSATVHVNT